MSARTFVLTPFQATKIFNAHRATLGLKPVNSPMLYIQARKGKFEVNLSADGRKQIANYQEFCAWVVEHNTRQVARQATKADEEHVEALRLAICS
jgi:hypothetical protein